MDGRSAKAAIGKPGVSSADTNDPLYVGGAPGEFIYQTDTNSSGLYSELQILLQP